MRAKTLLARLDQFRSTIRSEFKDQDQEVAIAHPMVTGLEELLAGLKAGKTTTKKMVEVEVDGDGNYILPEELTKLRQQDTERATITHSVGQSAIPGVPDFDPNAPVTSTALPRETPHVNRAPEILDATADSVEDKSLLATAGEE